MKVLGYRGEVWAVSVSVISDATSLGHEFQPTEDDEADLLD